MNYKKVDINNPDSMIVNELRDELDLSQYDLHETDILRAIKINNILNRYKEVFNINHSLEVFFIVAKASQININSIFNLLIIKKNDFLNIIKELRYYELIDTDSNSDVTLTPLGKEFAKELGVDIFI